MWVCLNNAFVSAVESEPGSSTLKVRARKLEHLKRLFPDAQVHESPRADYRFRVFVLKTEFAELVKRKALEIDYDNFKDSVEEPGLHALYGSFWTQHWRYQNGRTL